MCDFRTQKTQKFSRDCLSLKLKEIRASKEIDGLPHYYAEDNKPDRRRKSSENRTLQEENLHLKRYIFLRPEKCENLDV